MDKAIGLLTVLAPNIFLQIKNWKLARNDNMLNLIEAKAAIN